MCTNAARSAARRSKAIVAAAVAALIVGAGCGCGGASTAGRTADLAERPRRVPGTADPAQAHHRDPARSAIGTNLDGPYDWSTAMPFVDQFRVSRPWVSVPVGDRTVDDDHRPLDLDANGWIRSLAPGQAARTGLLWDHRVSRPGRYLVLWEGQGDIVYFGGVDGHLVAAESRPGRHVIEWNPAVDGGDLGIEITRVDPQDPIRDIRVLPPGGSCEDDERRYCDGARACEGGARCVPFEESYRQRPFNPDFLATMSGYSVIRTMNWQLINDSRIARWSERTTLDSARWSAGAGVPIEVLVQLANTLGADLWVCSPHLADDEFVREMARVIHARLAPGLRVYFEYSNETWNSIFVQWEHARDEGLRLGLGGPERDHTFAQIRYHARRTVEVQRAFAQGFPDRARVIRVLAGHAVNPWVFEQMLAFEGTAGEVDALAIAPYFGIIANQADRERLLAMGVDGLLEDARTRDIPEVLGFVRQQVALARQHHLRVIAYEGGQHYVTGPSAQHDEELNRLFDQVNADPRFEDVYLAYLQGWREAGGETFAHFVHCAGAGAYGRWGAIEWWGQPESEAPKLRALHRFMDENPRWF